MESTSGIFHSNAYSYTAIISSLVTGLSGKYTYCNGLLLIAIS